MKKKLYSIFVAAALCLSGCGTTGLGMMGDMSGVGTGATTAGGTGLGVLGSILGGLGGMVGGTGTSSGTSSGSGSVLGGILGSVINSNTAYGLLDMVIGHVKINPAELVGTWVYSEPGCAFTSENLLAKAGGSVAATQVKQKLNSVFNSIGVSSQNTAFAFAQNGQFEAYIKGIPLSGTYTFDSNSSRLDLRCTLFTIPTYVTRTANGLSITMESKKLLSVLQTLTKLTGNSTLSAIGDLSKNFDGVRLGFDVVKYQ